MVSGVGGIAGGMMGGMSMRTMGAGNHQPPPSPEKVANRLFSKIDSSDKGYIEKSDLQSAFNSISSTSSDSDTTSSVDDLFTQLDSDSDGKVTKEEFVSTLKSFASQNMSQFQSARMEQGGVPPAGMPPNGMGGQMPPPGGQDEGLSQDELSSQLEEIGRSDSQRSSFISNVVDHFDEADADSNGKVTFDEAKSYNDSNSTSGTGSNTSQSSVSSTAADDPNTKIMKQIAQLIQAYGIGKQQDSQSFSTLLSVSA